MATHAFEQIGQSRPGSTAFATLATLASGGEWVNARVVIANTTAGALTYRVCHDDNGTTHDETTALAWDVSIAANSVAVVEGICGSTATGTVGVRSSSASGLTFTMYGMVRT
jgi:hypothetical protein